jgi:FMN phosphatase YigB (HAD superfamily)
MIKALLLDLDDTLLGNNTSAFMEHYFALLDEYTRPVFDQADFLPALLRSTQATIVNTDPALTNAEVFWANFEALMGGRRNDLEPFFRRFYETEFPRLRSSIEIRPAAAELIQAAHQQNLAIVIATNPLFPLTAIEQRLEWAGIPITRYPYALVTAYENMHATKPQPAYYCEILDLIGRSPEEALMAGDDWKNDIAPAAAAGLHAYWITDGQTQPPDPALICGQGTLDELTRIVVDDGLGQLIASSTA